MMAMISSEKLDAKLNEIAHQIREQHNDLSHNLDTGNDVMMVRADRELAHLRRIWDRTLLSQGIACRACQKIKPLALWKFSCKIGQERLIETSTIQCPCCDLTTPTSEHQMAARIMCLVNRAYLPIEELLFGVEFDHE
jgi:hypothetical protein